MASNDSSNLHVSALTDLTGRVALVTGGGTGMCVFIKLSNFNGNNYHDIRGLMIAKGLASNGAIVYIGGRRVDVLGEASNLRFGQENEKRIIA